MGVLGPLPELALPASIFPVGGVGTVSMDDQEKGPEQAAANSDTVRDRREALRQLGKFGAYTAPFLLAVLSSEAAAQSGSTD